MRTFILFLTIITIASCVVNPNPIDVDIPEPEQRLVISSFAIPPQELAVTLTRTFSALLGKDSVDLQNANIASKILVDSALIVLSYSGRTDTLQKILPAIYGSLTAQQVYNTPYTLQVKDYITGLEVTARTMLLPPVALDSVFPVVSQNANDTLANFKGYFTDMPGQENYYLVTYTNFRSFSQQLLTPTSSVFNFNNLTFDVFSDKKKGDGKQIEFEPLFPAAKGDTLAVALSNITKGYYEYLAAYQKSGNLLSQLIKEPINLPTNVEGGYGYFALIRPKVKLVVLK